MDFDKLDKLGRQSGKLFAMEVALTDEECQFFSNHVQGRLDPNQHLFLQAIEFLPQEYIDQLHHELNDLIFKYVQQAIREKRKKLREEYIRALSSTPYKET